MMGDSATDIEAGKRAGCRTALIAQDTPSFEHSSDLIATSLYNVVCRIMAQETLPKERDQVATFSPTAECR